MKQLHDVLNERVDAGITVQFWLRDDDAVEPTPKLDQLLALADGFAVPLTLASIPASSGTALAERLASEERVSVAVHGWSHQNHASANEKKQELGLHRPSSLVLDELSRGLAHLSQLHDKRFVPLLVPPWNRIDALLVKQLTAIGFHGLSTFGKQSSGDIAVMNSHVDVIDWKGTRGGRTTSELEAEIVTQLQSSSEPIGILTHHLVHDDQVWGFLEQLFAMTSNKSGISWMRIDDLLPELRPDP